MLYGTDGLLKENGEKENERLGIEEKERERLGDKGRGSSIDRYKNKEKQRRIKRQAETEMLRLF